MMAPKLHFKLWPTIGTIVGLCIVMPLGIWQHGRRNEKLALEAERTRQLKLPPITIKTLSDLDPAQHNFRKVTMRGALDTSRVVLFRHRHHEGRPGFWVAAPLRLDDGSGAVWANLGWLSVRGGEEAAKQLAATQPPAQAYTGLLHVPSRIIADPKTRAQLKAGTLKVEGGLTSWRSYDLQALSDALPYPHPKTPLALVLDASHSGDPFPIAGADHITQPYLTAERHEGYMVFWYGTAAVLLALYLASSLGMVTSGRGRQRPQSLGGGADAADQ